MPHHINSNHLSFRPVCLSVRPSVYLSLCLSTRFTSLSLKLTAALSGASGIGVSPIKMRTFSFDEENGGGEKVTSDGASLLFLNVYHG